jgi:hypothetical protein
MERFGVPGRSLALAKRGEFIFVRAMACEAWKSAFRSNLPRASESPASFQVAFETACTDSRWKDITVRQLLQHTGGWDSRDSFDPMFEVRRIAAETGDLSEPLFP